MDPKIPERELIYNELSRYIPDATAKMLTIQLRNLEQNGLIERTLAKAFFQF